jgi:hypothetical protein
LRRVTSIMNNEFDNLNASTSTSSPSERRRVHFEILTAGIINNTTLSCHYPDSMPHPSRAA